VYKRQFLRQSIEHQDLCHLKVTGRLE